MSDTKQPSPKKVLTRQVLEAIASNCKKLVTQYNADTCRQQGVLEAIQYIIDTYELAEEKRCLPPLEVK